MSATTTLSAGSGINLASLAGRGGLDPRAAAEAASRIKEQQEAAVRGVRGPGRGRPDDLDLAAEEEAEAARLSSLLPQLRDAAEREAGGTRMVSLPSRRCGGKGRWCVFINPHKLGSVWGEGGGVRM